jgi:hypothetical protein
MAQSATQTVRNVIASRVCLRRSNLPLISRRLPPRVLVAVLHFVRNDRFLGSEAKESPPSPGEIPSSLALSGMTGEPDPTFPPKTTRYLRGDGVSTMGPDASLTGTSARGILRTPEPDTLLGTGPHRDRLRKARRLRSSHMAGIGAFAGSEPGGSKDSWTVGAGERGNTPQQTLRSKQLWAGPPTATVQPLRHDDDRGQGAGEGSPSLAPASRSWSAPFCSWCWEASSPA